MARSRDRSPRVIVVSHEASRTGAPRIAGLVLRALRGRGLRTHLVLRWGGSLEQELRDAADGSSYEPMRSVRAFARRRHHARVARAIEEMAALLTLLRRRPDLVWANTSKSANWVRPCLLFRVPVVLHIHETGSLASSALQRYALTERWASVALVACSEAARDDLSDITGIRTADIAVLRSAVDERAIADRASAIDRTPTDALVVGACGLANAGKGFDLFIEMARLLASSDEAAVIFRWVGYVDATARELVARAGAVDVVQLVGEVDDAVAELARMDVVVVPSRADAFPLVVLESMALERPIVGFAVGGIPEQIGSSGVLVEPEDTAALAAAVSALLADPAARTRLGRRAGERLRGNFGLDRFDAVVADVLTEVGLIPRSAER